MISENYQDAWTYTKELIDKTKLFQYQGVIDITDNFNFHNIADDFNLTSRQYNQLINKAQAYADKQAK